MSKELTIIEASTKLDEATSEDVAGSEYEVQAQTHTIIDADTYAQAEELRVTVRGFIKDVHDRLDPVCEAANKTHKTATATRKSFLEPYENAESILKSKMVEYQQAEERKRKAAEAKARREAEEKARAERERLEAEKREEAERLAREAEELAAAGDTEQAEALLEVAAEREAEVIEEVEPIVPSFAPATKLAGTYVPTWDVELVDIKKLCRAVASGKVPESFVTFADKVARPIAKSLKGDEFNRLYESYGIRSFDKGSIR